MKFSVLQQDLLPALQAVVRSVGVRSSLPVLDNILISTEGSKIKIAATNLEIGIIKFLDVEVDLPGEITVPAKTIVELVSGLKQTKIDIEADVNILTVTAGKFKATVNGIPATEFPVIPLAEGKGVNFKKDVLSICSQILFAAAVDDGRPVLTGILTHAKKDGLDFVATDGFRLAHRHIDLIDRGEEFKILIPRRTFEEVLKTISESLVEDVSIATTQSQNQVIFDFGGTIISSRLIEGNYPNWEKIIPTQNIVKVLVDKEELLKAIKLAAIFAKNEANVIILNVGEDKISLESSAKELGSQQNEIDCKVEGEAIKIAFNSKFLQDAVSNVPSEQLIMEFSGSLTASLIRPVGIEGLEYIVMPVRLNE